jgi:hypothetical protein
LQGFHSFNGRKITLLLIVVFLFEIARLTGLIVKRWRKFSKQLIIFDGFLLWLLAAVQRPSALVDFFWFLIVFESDFSLKVGKIESQKLEFVGVDVR